MRNKTYIISVTAFLKAKGCEKMNFGETEIVREEGNIRLLKIGCRNDKISYCVIGNGSTKHFDDYDDALEEFYLRWMKEKYGD